jgi:PAS domain S-box-containing protein
MPESRANYSFIDIAVWEGVRENFISGNPIAVFTPNVETLLWANGRAAELFGYETIGDFETEGPAGMRVAVRQIRAAASRLDGNGEIRTMLRITSGMTSKLLPARIRQVYGPNREACLAVIIEAESSPCNELAAATAAISGLAAEGAGAAIADADGHLLAADALFTELSFPPEALAELINDVRDEEDRLVKRLVASAAGQQIAVAIARLTDTPACHLVMAVTTSANDESDTTIPSALLDLSAEAARTDAVGGPLGEPDQPGELPGTIQAATPDMLAKDDQAEAADDMGADLEATEAEPFSADFENERGPVRFVWKTDRDGKFIDISPEFASAVGPNAADVVERTFEEIARVFELDPSGEITASLKRRDTWSGKTVLWPVQGTGYRVPVDLAALPSYNRDRDFEGYRGFGIIRMGERKPDPEQLGLAQTKHAKTGGGGNAAIDDRLAPDMPEPSARPDEDKPAEEVSDTANLAETDPFNGEVPALTSISPHPLRRENDKIIDFNAKRRHQSPGEPLNPAEQAAFRQIGDALGWARASAGVNDSAEHNDQPPGKDQSTRSEECSNTVAEAGDRNIHRIADNDTDTGSKKTPEVPEYGQSDMREEHVPQAADGQESDIDAGTTETVADADDAADPVMEVSAEEHLPSAFATGAARRDAGEETADQQALAPAFLDALPLPVLIHRDGEALFANEAFAAISGFADAAALNATGGIEALFSEEAMGDGVVSMHTAGGDVIATRTHLQRVPWNSAAALMFAFEPAAANRPFEDHENGAAATAAMTDSQISEAAELRAILDTATDGVVVLSNEGVIRSINGSASALFGYSNDETEGKSFTMLFARESQSAAINYVHGLANNGVASVLNEGLEVLGREKNGGFLPLFMTIGRLDTSNGFCAVLRDITAWKQTEQALLDAQRSAEEASSHKTEFLAKISHEIRTPLNAIIGFSELMAEERFGPIGNERYKSYLSDINKSGKYVLDLVNDLLDISKIEAGKQELEFESVALNVAVSEAVAMIQPQANRNRIIVRSSLDEDLPEVVADERSMKQIVLNLLSNSVRFTHSGGQVIVNTSYNARGEVVLRIKDTGIGMSAKEIEMALQPFQQVASLGRAKGDGTGLGLPLTKALVEANRAEFAIKSEPGRGTAVEVVFPPSRVLAS